MNLAFFRFLPTEHHVYLSIFGIILTSTYIVTTFYTQEHRRVRIRCSNPKHHKQYLIKLLLLPSGGRLNR